MFDIFDIYNYYKLGHYNYIPDIKKRGKGHNKQAHKNNYKQKIKNRGRKK